jgi:Methyltransferase domain
MFLLMPAQVGQRKTRGVNQAYSRLAMAINLMQAAQCIDGGKVLGMYSVLCIPNLNMHHLDVGYGTGESLVFLLSDHRVPRPSSLTGITSLAKHHRRAQNRIARLLSSLPDPKPEVVLYAGDAVYHHRTAFDHPLDPSSQKCFNTILALDCAYHFDTRSEFLSQSYVKLVPEGRIALADICIDPSSLRYGQAWLITSFFRLMPKQNMVSTKQYVSVMKEIGYVDVQLRDITQDVFPGFIKFLRRKGWGWWFLALVLDWYANTGARFVIVTGAR